MKYRGHMDYDDPDDATEVVADSRRKAAEKIAELLDKEIENDDPIPGSRNIIVWPVENEAPLMELYDRRREFEVTPRIAYFARAKDDEE